MGFQSEVDSIASVRQVRAILKRAGRRPAPHLGQYFLVNQKVARKLILSEDVLVRKNDVVIEPGAGIGCLSFHIAAEAKKVFAVEIDGKLCEVLSELVRDLGFKNIEIINKDILDIDPTILGCNHLGYKVIGSLPYNLSKKIIRKFLEAKVKPSVMSVLIQKEVAMEYVSRVPGNTFLAEWTRVFSEARYIETIKKLAFYPVPPVDGAIVVFKILRYPIVPEEQVQSYIKFLRAGFSAKRKTLPNILSSKMKINKKKLLEVFLKVGIDPNVRPQEVTTEKWLKLWSEISAKFRT